MFRDEAHTIARYLCSLAVCALCIPRIGGIAGVVGRLMRAAAASRIRNGGPVG